MGTMPAWQRREMERQELLEDLERKMGDAHEACDEVLNRESETFLFELAFVILAFLGEEHSNAKPVGKQTLTDTATFTSAKSFWREALNQLNKFSRSDVERNEAAAIFFEKYVLPRLNSHFRMEAQSERLENPRRILQAERGDKEVPIRG